MMLLSIFERNATTSVNTTLGATRVYLGELFHCDNPDIVLSCVQDGADHLLLDIHNPTDAPRRVTLTAVPGFTPLSGLKMTVNVPPCSSSSSKVLTVARDTLRATPYLGE
jgi:hypothetical protein